MESFEFARWWVGGSGSRRPTLSPDGLGASMRPATRWAGPGTSDAPAAFSVGTPVLLGIHGADVRLRSVRSDAGPYSPEPIQSLQLEAVPRRIEPQDSANFPGRAPIPSPVQTRKTLDHRCWLTNTIASRQRDHNR